MSKPAILIQGLGKRYLLGSGGGESYRALRDVIVNSVTSLWDKTKKRNSLQEFWALKDFELRVHDGETIGIIGRNGAGKSTLLKLLSQITEPTTGEIRLHGRVASLLEVGTGFHPELTGNENIYMNGSILGMKRAEIKRKYDEIVAFAEIEKFLDTPVKRYSSGMYVRLAFAVAAHLEPEILLVDEVLAVGDVQFQKKCIGKMSDVTKKGRTVLIVSHNMATINNLCNRGVLLTRGEKSFDGQAKDAVNFYLESASSLNGQIIWESDSKSPGNENLRLRSIKIFQEGITGPTADIDISKEVKVQITYHNYKANELLYTCLLLKDKLGTLILATNNHPSVSLTKDYWSGCPQPMGIFQAVCSIPKNFLNEGAYNIAVIIGRNVQETLIYEDDVLALHAHDSGEMRKEFYGGWGGLVRPKFAWSTELVKE